MAKRELKQEIVIDGNSITPADLDNLKDIKKNFEEARRTFSFLSLGAQQFLYDLHSEDTQVGHLVRWGEQHCEEAISKIRTAATSNGVPTPFPPDGDKVDPFMNGDRIYFGRGPFEFIGHIVEEGDNFVICNGVEPGCLAYAKKQVRIEDLEHLRRVDSDEEWQRLIQNETAFV